MKWILIFWVSSIAFKAGGPATATFETEAACRDAARLISRQWDVSASNLLCVPSGEAKSVVRVPQSQ